MFALAENRKNEVGVVGINCMAAHELLVWHVSDDKMYSDTLAILRSHEPVEVVCCDYGEERSLTTKARELFHGAQNSTRIIMVARSYFNPERGSQLLQEMASNLSSCSKQLLERYNVSAATACLLKYVEYIQGITFMPGSLRLIENGPEGHMIIDFGTQQNLELVTNSRDPSSRGTLFGVLNRCKTDVGKRLLRTELLSPSNDQEVISARCDVVELFLGADSGEKFLKTMEVLCSFTAIDPMLSQLVTNPKATNVRTCRQALDNLIRLKHNCELLPRLVKVLDVSMGIDTSESPLLTDLLQVLSDPQLAGVLAKIGQYITPSTSVSSKVQDMRLQEVWAIKPGNSGLLDVARETYFQVVKCIYELGEAYREEHDLEISVHFTASRGYHLLLIGEHLPDMFIQSVMKGKKIFTTTEDLESLSSRSEEAYAEIICLTNEVTKELLKHVMQYMQHLYKLADAIAMIDMLLGFACLVTEKNSRAPYTRPHLGKEGPLVIQQGRHPVIECLCKDVVPNDIILDPDMSSCTLITGPNCAGKSTLLKMVAHVTIMAHIGCFVPAVGCWITLRDQVCMQCSHSTILHRMLHSCSLGWAPGTVLYAPLGLHTFTLLTLIMIASMLTLYCRHGGLNLNLPHGDERDCVHPQPREPAVVGPDRRARARHQRHGGIHHRVGSLRAPGAHQIAGHVRGKR